MLTIKYLLEECCLKVNINLLTKLNYRETGRTHILLQLRLKKGTDNLNFMSL
jgi:hypothetical protein